LKVKSKVVPAVTLSDWLTVIYVVVAVVDVLVLLLWYLAQQCKCYDVIIHP
jgi:hypothetical protein